MIETEKLKAKINEYNIDLNKGYSNDHATSLLIKNGKNEITAKKQDSIMIKFFKQFLDPMVILLVIAAIISLVLAITDTSATGMEKIVGYVEPVLIGVIVILNACFGTAQEAKAEKAVDALRKMSSPNANVLRDGTIQIIPANQIVVGDIIILNTGDLIPADAVLIEAASLKCEESMLTGESLPSEKDATFEAPEGAPIGDYKNLVFSGCSVVYGRARALVTHTGMNTEMGKIANLLNNAETQLTPLQMKLAKLGKLLGFLAVIICLICFFVSVYVVGEGNWSESWSDSLMTAVSLAVAAIPEGLLAIITVVLALGVQRMVKHNALIKKLPAVETLGSASIICSDKTGTLTQNKMTITNTWTSEATTSGLDITNIKNLNLLKYATLCSDATYEANNDVIKQTGDPTEIAIVMAAYNHQMKREDLLSASPRLGEIPFDSNRKLMTTIHRFNNKIYAVVKGAPDIVFNLTKNKDVLADAKAINQTWGNQALRVLAVAIKELKEIPKILDPETLEKDLELYGLMAMIDPPRPEVKTAVALCKQAGMRPIMITGDHINTATAIASQLGILELGQKTISGAELAILSDEQLKNSVVDYSVYARVSPEDKIRIVKAWQSQNQIVAMTGDGVNDAPALKAANIGCAMGITGTDVSKGAADIILTDDNFATIIEAVKEGRGILDNIKRVIQFLLGTNIGEIIVIFFGMIIFNFTPFSALQLLWINLITDSLPAIALGMKKPEDSIMKFEPNKKINQLFTKKSLIEMVCQGMLFGILALLSFYLGVGAFYHFNLNDIRTNLQISLTEITGDPGYAQAHAAEMMGSMMCFITLALSQCIQCYNLYSSKSLFKTAFKDLRYLHYSFVISFILIYLIVYIPGVNEVFNMNPYASYQGYDNNSHIYLHFVAIGLGLVPTALTEIYKVVDRNYLTRFFPNQ